MSRWFRFYDDSINDPKLLRLPDDLYRAWVGLLCIASKNKGTLPPADDIALMLRLKPTKVAEWITRLATAGLIDNDDGVFSPHNWTARQYQSDSSKDRVQRHRNKRAAAGLKEQWFAPSALRKKVYEADNFECVYCGSAEYLSIDHKTSELNGGTHDFDNLVTACRSCNGAKRDLSFDEYVTKSKIETLHGRFSNVTRKQNTESEQSRADASAPADEGLKKKVVALQFGIGALFTSRQQPIPNLDRCLLWLTQGYAAGTVLGAIESVLKRGKAISTLDYFDGAIADAHAKAPTPSELQVVSTQVFIVEGTLEWNCWDRHLRLTRGRGSPVTDNRDENGRLRRGWFRPTLVPEGYDEATGERIAPQSEENAA